MKKKIETNEEAPVNSVAGGGVDMSPGKKAVLKKKPLKRFKDYVKGEK
jgi:hypothetical protein